MSDAKKDADAAAPPANVRTPITRFGAGGCAVNASLLGGTCGGGVGLGVTPLPAAAEGGGVGLDLAVAAAAAEAKEFDLLSVAVAVAGDGDPPAPAVKPCATPSIKLVKNYYSRHNTSQHNWVSTTVRRAHTTSRIRHVGTYVFGDTSEVGDGSGLT